MSALHAGYSIAGLAGAGLGGISAWLGISPLPTFTVTAGALIGLGLLAGPRVVLPAADPGSPPEQPEDLPRRPPEQISTVPSRGDTGPPGAPPAPGAPPDPPG